jgi:hypothetical protein
MQDKDQTDRSFFGSFFQKRTVFSGPSFLKKKQKTFIRLGE